MEQISLFKSSTGHFFQKREDCEAWENRVKGHESVVYEAFKDDLGKSGDDNFPPELMMLIAKQEAEGISNYLSAFAKIAYWFNNSPLNYEEGFVSFRDKLSDETFSWLKRHRSSLMDK